MKTIKPVIILTALILMAGCSESLVKTEYENSALENFECLWENYDRYYGQFTVRNINWDSLHTVYYPLINETSSDQDLYDVFNMLIAHFHDDHVFIDPAGTGLPRIESGRSDTMKVQTDFLPETVSRYLLQEKKYSEHIWYGMLQENTGYIRMDVFVDPKPFLDKAFNKILEELKDTRGIVFDIRKLEGGG